MTLIGASYWNIGSGRDVGDVEKDEEGLATMTNLGRTMAWALKTLTARPGPAVLRPPGPLHASLIGERLLPSRLSVFDLADAGRGVVHRLVVPARW
jgi:hypothetical protein